MLLLRSEMEEEEEEITVDDKVGQGTENVAMETVDEVLAENKQK